jgi:hypothetical protein
MCLSVLLHLFFFFLSHYFLKHTKMILSFHMQKVHIGAYITQRCAECLYIEVTQSPACSIFFPHLSPNLSPLFSMQNRRLQMALFIIRRDEGFLS